MSTIIDVRAGIKGRLNTIPHLNASGYIPNNIICPAAFPMPVSGAYGYTMATNISFPMVIIIVTDLAQSLENAQRELDLYIEESGAKSIPAAIEGDATLGGSCSVCRVVGFEDYGFIVLNNLQYLGCRVRLEIFG